MAYIGQSLTEGSRQQYHFTTASGQSAFAAAYVVGQVDVFVNGVLKQPSEYTATDGVTVTIAGLSTGDKVSIMSEQTFSVADAVPSSTGGTFNGNVVVTGNLTVSGSTVTVNSNEVNIGDNIIKLNSDETGTPSQNAGIEVERGSATNVALRWNESTDKWQVTENGSLYINLASELYYTTSKKLEATSSGVTAVGAVVSDGLTVDTNTLYVDSSNNRVGIGTTSPSVKLHVDGGGSSPELRVAQNSTYYTDILSLIHISEPTRPY